MNGKALQAMAGQNRPNIKEETDTCNYLAITLYLSVY